MQFIKQLKLLQKAEIADYSPGLNTVKAILVLLVIFGHSINIYSNLQIVYFFHMPLFLSISGFLVKKSAFNNGLLGYLKKLLNRAIIPWLIAFLAFIPIALNNQPWSNFSISNILYPYYHLWYIPAYVFAVIFCYFTQKLKIPTWLILLFTALITSFWFVTYRNNVALPQDLPLYFLGDKRIYGYLFFFYLGFAIRNKIINFRPNAWLLMATILLTGITILLFIFKHLPEYTLLLPYLFCNISLILFVIIYTAKQNWTNNPFIQFLNNQSLGIYLYHPLFIFMAYQYLDNPEMNKTSNLDGGIIFVIATFLSTVLVWLLTQFEITNKYFLGNVKSQS
jgi:fucose 4-O-acetylase-like acetyltransferase